MKTLSNLLSTVRHRGWLQVGADLGTRAIKIVRLAKNNGKFQIISCSYAEQNGEELPTVRNVLSQWGEVRPRVALSISDAKVEVLRFRLPNLPDTEKQQALQWELKKRLTSLDDYLFDVLTWKDPQGQEVQCVAAPRRLLEGMYSQGTSLGFASQALEPESSALYGYLAATEGPKLDRVAIIDLGFSSFRLIFIHKDRISFTRPLYFGLSTIVNQVSQELNLQFQEIETLSQELSKGNSNVGIFGPTWERIFHEWLYTLCEEFHKSEQFIAEQNSLEETTQVYLCGGGACLPSSLSYFGQHLSDKKVEILNPFARLKSATELPDPISGPTWVCAIGLCMRESL